MQNLYWYLSWLLKNKSIRILIEILHMAFDSNPLLIYDYKNKLKSNIHNL